MFKVGLCLFNYWDNLDCSVECGYVGVLLWDWWWLFDICDLCYVDYVCVNVLFGINGVVLNNVNVKVELLIVFFFVKVVVLVDVLWFYGIKVWLLVCFLVLVELGGLKMVDLLDLVVCVWW